MPDGSLRIKTRLDNSNLDKDTQVLENKIKKLQVEISKNSLEQKGLEKEIQEFEQLHQKADEYINKIRELKIEKDAIFKSNPALAFQGNMPEYENIKVQIEQMRQKYAQASMEIDKQAPKIEKIYGKLDKVKAKQQENNSKMQEYKQKIEEARNKQKELNVNTEGIGKSINSGMTKILRYGAALLSIRSIYGLLSNTMNSWLDGNSKGAKQLKSDIDYMKNTIGRALSPILQYIVNLLYQALGFTGALIKAFTGVDIFAGSVADYMEATTSSASKTNKELKKQLASFDRINKLNDNNSNKNSSGGVVTPSKDLSSIMTGYTEIAEKIKNKFDEIKDLIPIIGAGILAWKLSDLFFSQLKGLDALKAKVGLTLLITGLAVWYNGVSGFKDGKISGQDLLKMVGGAIGAGVGVGMLTSSVSLGLSIGLLLLSVGMAEGGKNTLQGLIGKKLGIERDASKASTYYMFSFELELLAKITGQDSLVGLLASNMKNILLEAANYVENIPFIGKSIAKGIRSAVEASETDTTEVIKYSTQEALENANPWIKTVAEKTGKETRQAYQRGFTSLTDETSNVINNEQIEAINNASPGVNRHAYREGQKEAQSVNEGIGSESLAQGTDKLLNTGRTELNKSTLFTEGQNLGETIRNGYSNNDITDPTQVIVEGAKNALNSSSLSLEGQKLSESAGQGVNKGSWQVEEATRELANKANNSLSSNMKGYSAGENLISGIKKGINSNKSSLFTTISKVGSSILSTFKNVLGIHSPSREMASLAKFIPLGIAEGVDSTSDKAIGSMKNLVSGMQDTVDGMDYSNISQIPKLSRNAVSYVPKQAISTNEIQRSIVGQDSNMLNRILSAIQSSSKGKTSLTIPFIIDGEEWFKKTIELNEAYNLATNGGGL